MHFRAEFSPSSGLGIEANISETAVLSLSQLTIIATSNVSWATFEHNNRLAGVDETVATAQLVSGQFQFPY